MDKQNNNMKKEVAGVDVSLIGNRCYRCGHEWLPQDKNSQPIVCPKCKSPYWSKPRKKKKVAKK